MGVWPAKTKARDTLVDGCAVGFLDPGSSPGASTKQSNTKFLSNRSLGDMIAGAFAVLRVECVLKEADRAAGLCANLWT